MQLTIEVPDALAGRLEAERENLAEIFERGLRQRWAETSGLAREIIAFLARGPQPEEIVAFRPSAKFVERSRELLERNREATLSPAEEQELDEMAQLDNLFSLIKVEARRHLRAAA